MGQSQMRVGSYTIDLAGPNDDADLRRLLRDNPMAGDISVSLEREPSFFLGASVEGEPHQTYIGRDPGGRVVGLASRSVRTVFANGSPTRVGYLSQARINPEFRGIRPLLRAGFRFLRDLHDDGEARFYVSSIISDNRVARRFFEASWGDKPTYQPWAEYVTFAVPLFRRRRRPVLSGLVVRPATATDLDAIVEHLDATYRRFQLAPVWTAAALAGDAARDLVVGDFLVAHRRGTLVGCLARWDQRGFKQSVVRGYRGRIAVARPVANLAARIFSTPRLPDPGQPIPSCFLSHVAVTDDEPEVLEALLLRACNDARAAGDFTFVMIGFAERHPLAAVVRRVVSAIEYKSQLYLVYWPDGRAAAQALDERIPHLEAATF